MLVLRNIRRLYDGSGAGPAAVREGVDLFIDGARVSDLRPHDPGLALGDAHEVVDAAGFTVTPGIIDCHAHLTVGDATDAALAAATSHAALLHVEKILYRTLVDGGVTSARDIGGATDMVRRLVDEGVLIGPRLKIAICMLSTTGGHADYRGPDRCHATVSSLWPEAPGRPSSIVDGPWACRKRVREIAACGADLIKVCASPGVASPTDHLEHRDFTEEELRVIVDEAAARGLRVAAHAHSASGIELAIRCGVHDLQHISFMDERLVDMAHRADCTVTPTSWISAEIAEFPDFTPFVRDKARRVGEVHRAAVDYARRGGLRILAGTDAILPGMHARNYMEIAHLIRDGLDPLAAWYGATGLAARELGFDDTGVLAPGKRADLLVCSADVIADPARMDSGLTEVVKDGEAYRGAIAAFPRRSFASTVATVLGERAVGHAP